MKKVVIAGMVIAASSHLRRKITREGWSQGISFEWVDLVSRAPKKVVQRGCQVLHCFLGRSTRMMTHGLLSKIHDTTTYVKTACNLVTPFLELCCKGLLAATKPTLCCREIESLARPSTGNSFQSQELVVFRAKLFLSLKIQTNALVGSLHEVILLQVFFFIWMLHGSTKVVVRAAALLSANTKD